MWVRRLSRLHQCIDALVYFRYKSKLSTHGELLEASAMKRGLDGWVVRGAPVQPTPPAAVVAREVVSAAGTAGFDRVEVDYAADGSARVVAEKTQ
jgi:hypothetical protein